MEWAGKGAAAFGLSVAAFLALKAPSPLVVCEDVASINLVTYNVLAPNLGRHSHYPTCKAEDCDPQKRLPKILGRLEEYVASGTIIALQEIDLEYAGKMHVFFAERGYTVVFGQYGKQFNGYMGIMIAWPTRQYETVDVEISRVSDTAPAGTWPKATPQAASHPHGMFTRHGMKQILGCNPPSFDEAADDFEWKLAKDRMNEALFVRLRPRDDPRQSFVVSSYHMPCLFGSAPKVRVVNIHTYLLLKRLHDFSKGDPAILMGDFNFQPDTSPYCMCTSGGSYDLVQATGSVSKEMRGHHSVADEVQGLESRLPTGQALPGGLASAYRAFYGEEPLFTNYAQSLGQKEPFCETLDYIWYTPGHFDVVHCPALPKARAEVDGPFPSASEPSDHLPLRATLRKR